jgi:hypothetical protein
LLAESKALQNATRLAELATNASANFKAMIEEKRRIDAEMKKLSPARLRWIKAINRVLIANYIENVKNRLLNSSFADWFRAAQEKMEAEEEAEREAAEAAEKAARIERESLARQRSILAANTSSKSSRISNAGARGDRGTAKIQRRSLDNSQLPTLVQKTAAAMAAAGMEDTMGFEGSVSAGSSSKMAAMGNGANLLLPSLATGGPSMKSASYSPSTKTLPEKLLLDPMERRRQARAEAEAAASLGGSDGVGGGGVSTKSGRVAKTYSRRSFGGETSADLTKALAGVGEPSSLSSGKFDRPLPATRPPSLLESYTDKTPKLVNQSSTPLIDLENSALGIGPASKSMKGSASGTSVRRS